MSHAPNFGDLLSQTRIGFSLPRALYIEPETYRADLEHIWHREWIFAGHDCEIPRAGDYFTMQVGDYSVIVSRDGHDGIRAFHNTCRHRGFKLCEHAKGSVKRRFVCPYHQWSYELDGRLARARQMGDDFDKTQYGLKTAHVAAMAGYIFVCVGHTAPDFSPVAEMLTPCLGPFDLKRSKIAFETTVIERGNWKLVMENNRECYHCAGSHPELCRTFPEAPTHAGGGSAEDQAVIDNLVADCEAIGLPGRYAITANGNCRVMRMPFLDNARSMTMTGEAACSVPLGKAPVDRNIGDLLFYHFPNTWNHVTADHALSFRILPISATQTELTTKWLVHEDAVAGQDYDLDTLTKVWLATNAQDATLVETNQAGILSPAYEPGPYSAMHESGVMQFVEWYKAQALASLASSLAAMAERHRDVAIPHLEPAQ